MCLKKFLIANLIVGIFHNIGIEGGRHEDRLIKHLLEERNYQKISRPVKKEEESVVVSLVTSLQSVLDVNEKNELIVTRLWFIYKWNDPRLTWDPSEYGGVDSIRIDWKKVWTPDLVLYNSAAEAIDSKYAVNVIFTSNGSCTWFPLGIWTSSCSMDITWFPFDLQKCYLKFGVWTHTDSQVNLTMPTTSMNLNNYVMNGEWHLIEAPSKRSVRTYTCCKERRYVDITYTVVIRRRTLFYGSNLIVPCALISSVTLFTFLLPSDCNAKLTLGVTILLALSVFQLIVTETVPSTSLSVPLIGIYFAFLMILTTVSLVVTSLVINFHYKTPEFYKISPFVQKYINNYLARLMGMSRPENKPQTIKYQKKEKASRVTRPSGLRKCRSDSNLSLFATLFSFKQQLAGILCEMKFVTKTLKDGDTCSDEINEWKFAARVIDRFSFFTFLIILIIGTLSVMYSCENVRLPLLD